MDLSTFFKKFDQFADAPDAMAKLRELVLELAVRGHLSERRPKDQDGSAWRTFLAKFDNRNYGSDPGPPSPFPIPAEWRWVGLAEAADCRAGTKVSPTDIKDSDWVLDLEDIDGETGTVVQFATFAQRSSLSTKAAFEPGDVLYGKLRPYLNKVVVAAKRGFCTTEIVPLRPAPFLSPAFLRFYLRSQSFLSYAARKNYGMKMPRLGTKDLESAEVPVPPPEEQKRIVAKVDELMALCDRLEAQQQERETRHAALARASLARFATTPTVSNLKFLFSDSSPVSPADLRKSILTLAVQGKLVPQDPNDEPAAKLLSAGAELPEGHIRRRKIMKRAPIPSKLDSFPGLPSSWEYIDVQTLYDLNLIIDYADGNHGSLYPRSSEFGDSGVRFVTARDIANGRVSWDGCALLNEQRAHQLTKGWSRGGDVLLTHNATVGRVARTERDAGKFLLGTSVTFYRLNEKFIEPDYFYFVLCSPLWQGQLEGIMEQTTRNQVSIQKQAYFRIPVPPLAEQRRIVAKVEQLMALVDALEQQLATSRATAEELLTAFVADLTNHPN